MPRPTRDRAAAPGRARAVGRASSTRPSGCTARSPRRIRGTRSRSSGWRGSRSSGPTTPRRTARRGGRSPSTPRTSPRGGSPTAWRRCSRRAASALPEVDEPDLAPARGQPSLEATAASDPGLVDRLLRRTPPVKVLVTGGAGYVGGVSVDAILEAGHDVVVLDDLTTGHRAIVNPGARLVVGVVRGPGGDRAPARGRAARRDPPLRRAVAGRARASATRAATTATTWRAASPCSRPRAARGRRRASCSRRRRRSTACPDATPIEEDAPAPPDQPLRRDEAHVRGRAALVRGGLRAAEREPALLQRGRRDRPDRRGAPARDPPDPERAHRRERRPAADGVRRRLPDARRHADPRLHPRLGPRRCAPRGAGAGDRRRRARRPANRRSPATSGRPNGFSVREVLRRGRGRRRAARPARRWVRGAPATRRSSWPRTPAPGRCWAGRRAARRSTR